MQTETVDAEFSTSSSMAFSDAPYDVDPSTGEVLERRPVAMTIAAQRNQEVRAQLALGAAQAIAMAQKEKSLLEARMGIARERPRDWMMVRAKLLAECDRPGFADAAIYSKPVGGGKNHEDMSIRFAEACVRSAGNIRNTVEVVEDGPRTVTYRVTVLDMEGGSSFDEEFMLTKTVERTFLKDDQQALGERTNSRGKKTYIVQATEDDLANKKGAAASKLIRKCVLRLMPGDIVDECKARCERTIANRDAKNPAQARNNLLDAMSALGVTPKQVAEYLGKENAELITPAEVTKMRPIYTALKEGETTWRDIAEAKAGASKKAGPVAPQPPNGGSTPAAPAAQDPAATAPKEQVQPPQDPVEFEKQLLRKAMQEAKTKSDLKPILDRIRALPASDRAAMETEYKAASQKAGG